MESWKKVFRVGVAPLMGDPELVALLDALRRDDAALVQGCTTVPSPLPCVQDWPCEAACAVGYAGWKGLNLKTVGEVEEYFANFCANIDSRIGEPAGCRWFLNWFDEAPREEVRRLLGEEIKEELARRAEHAA